VSECKEVDGYEVVRPHLALVVDNVHTVVYDVDMAETKALEVVISTRVEASLRDDLQALADQAERRFADEVRRALRWYVLAEASQGRPEEAA